MKYVLTLIGNPSTPLSAQTVRSVADTLGQTGPATWLCPDHACDLTFDHLTPEEAVKQARASLKGLTLDIVAQPIVDRRKNLLVADMDSTIIEQECIDELADALGIKPQISDITARAMRGELEFDPALRERVGLLKGLAESALEEVYHSKITQTPGGRALCATMHANGGKTALVSGGFTYFTQRIAQAVGFDTNQANTLIIKDGILTGDVGEPILGRQAKVDALHSLSQQYGFPTSQTMAVGDGANDLGMIGEAGLGVALHAKPVVAAAAPAQIDHGDLTALLYIQGYNQKEIRQA
ncbi:MAG: phosphoserine phosphatase [Parvibaculaceae bacterium]|jgi:phosphoserine phosphatase